MAINDANWGVASHRMIPHALVIRDRRRPEAVRLPMMREGRDDVQKIDHRRDDANHARIDRRGVHVVQPRFEPPASTNRATLLPPPLAQRSMCSARPLHALPLSSSADAAASAESPLRR
jgi:hypothetical protein